MTKLKSKVKISLSPRGNLQFILRRESSVQNCDLQNFSEHLHQKIFRLSLEIYELM